MENENQVPAMEIQVDKISVQKGDVLVLKFWSLTQQTAVLEAIRNSLRAKYPENDILVLQMPPQSDLTFETMSKEDADKLNESK